VAENSTLRDAELHANDGFLTKMSSGVFSRIGSSKLQKNAMLSKVYLAELVPNILLVAFGTVVIWSASLTIADASFPRHLFGIFLGLIVAVLAWAYDVGAFADKSRFLLILDVVLMLMPHLPFLGYNTMGMTGWVQIPFVNFRFQPSEIAKPVTILLMAANVGAYNGKIETLRDYIKLCCILMVPFVLILTQPDLGTGLIVVTLGAAIIVCGGAKARWVLITLGIVVVGAIAVIAVSMTEGLPDILKPYQLNRLFVFVDPSVDPSGSAYNLQQAKIAVGSGGLFGKGIGNATQSASGFLPEAHTDFVFALLSEEFGFVGASFLLVLFAWLMLSAVGLANRCESMYEKLILVGLVGMWVFQVFENIGMCIGLMPITGVPLPFISYGSSSMIVQLMAVGIVQSIWFHRKKSA
jgi:rod shape determining protein RodA